MLKALSETSGVLLHLPSVAVGPHTVLKGENQLQLPASTVLREWKKVRLFDKANRKIKDMLSPDEFERRVIAEFTPEPQGLGSLAERLRTVLFHVSKTMGPRQGRT